MPFVLKQYQITKSQKIQHLLVNEFGFSTSLGQKLISKGRVFDANGDFLVSGQIPKGEFIQIAVFDGETKGLKPLFKTKDFAIFDKPSGLSVHPVSRKTEYSLLDEIRYHFGEDANLAHRIDQETSGLVLICKNKQSDIALKEMFVAKRYTKTYQAIVEGKIEKTIEIDTPIDKENGAIGVRMKVCQKGKESKTIITPLYYDKEKNQTLVMANPITGRQHQIRVHLYSIGHKIVGDPIYGVDDTIADSYLCKTLSYEDRMKYIGHSRLMLHARYLEFSYDNMTFKIFSKQQFV